MARPSRQVAPGVPILGIEQRVGGAEAEVAGHVGLHGRLDALGAGAGDVHVVVLEGDQVAIVVVECGRPDGDPAVQERLLEAEVEALALLRPQAVVAVDRGIELEQGRRLYGGAVAGAQDGAPHRHGIGAGDAVGGAAAEAFVVVVADAGRQVQVVPQAQQVLGIDGIGAQFAVEVGRLDGAARVGRPRRLGLACDAEGQDIVPVDLDRAAILDP